MCAFMWDFDKHKDMYIYVFMHNHIHMYIQGAIGLDTLVDEATNVIVQENQSNKVRYDMWWYDIICEDVIWYDYTLHYTLYH